MSSDGWVHDMRRPGETLIAAKQRLEAEGVRAPPVSPRSFTPRPTAGKARAVALEVLAAGGTEEDARLATGATDRTIARWADELRRGRR